MRSGHSHMLVTMICSHLPLTCCQYTRDWTGEDLGIGREEFWLRQGSIVLFNMAAPRVPGQAVRASSVHQATCCAITRCQLAYSPYRGSGNLPPPDQFPGATQDLLPDRLRGLLLSGTVQTKLWINGWDHNTTLTLALFFHSIQIALGHCGPHLALQMTVRSNSRTYLAASDSNTASYRPVILTLSR
ncbi:hypothetical protein GJAV_G00189270 [Gymnothorax javanicus]|nr:hypothetical protein GJAV_G00189270 [Gymnothorax javanicus]